MNWSLLTKPMAAAGRVLPFLILATLAWALSQFPAPFANVAAPDRHWRHVLVDKAFGSLDKVADFIFIASAAYIILSEVFDYLWTNKLQSEVAKAGENVRLTLRDGLSDLKTSFSTLAYEAVLGWVTAKRGTALQNRALAVTALKEYHALPHDQPNTLIDAVLDRIVEVHGSAAGQIWSTLNAQINVGPSDIPNHLTWDEERTYRVDCRAGKGEHELTQGCQLHVDREHLPAALRAMEYAISVEDNVIFSFAAWRNKHDMSKLEHGIRLKMTA